MAKIRLSEVVKGAEQLSLGISIVIAVMLGAGLGYWVMKQTGWTWALLAGFALGIAAAILNIKKAFNAHIKSLDELKDEVRYKRLKDDEDDDEI